MLLYVSLLNCFLSLLMLVFNWRMNRNVIFLASIIFLISIYAITYYFLAVDQSRFWAALFYANLSPLWYLPGPLLYWYVRGNLEDRINLRRSDWLHLLPAGLSLIGIIPYLLTSFQHKLETVDALFLDPHIPKLDSPNRLLPVAWNLMLRPGLLMAYSIFCIQQVWKARRSFSGSSAVDQDQWVFMRNWMFLLAGILIVMSIPPLVLSYFYIFDIGVDIKKGNAYSVSYATVYTHTLLSVILLIFPRILYGIPRSTTFGSADVTDNRHAVNVTSPGVSDHDKSPVADGGHTSHNLGPFVELSQRVLKYMEDQQPYVDPEFTLEGLAKSMDVPKHHLYYCFQNILKTKFTRLRTEFRVRHAKKLLTESDLTQTTINIVGKESGFASTSAFYTTFKAEVGCSPGEYAAKVNSSFPS
jgi:AraC-like DNA-binding protein